MNLRSFRTAIKWTGGILGYVIASLVVAVTAPFLYLVHICNGKCDDAPGTGLFLGFVAAVMLTIFLTIGSFLLIEILYCRLFAKTRIRRLRLLLREILGFGSLIGPVWVHWFWPMGSGFRGRFETPAMEWFIYCVSVPMFVIAVFLPFGFRMSEPIQKVSSHETHENPV